MSEQGGYGGAERVEVVRAVVPVELDLTVATRQLDELEARLQKLRAQPGDTGTPKLPEIRPAVQGETSPTLRPAVTSRDDDEPTDRAEIQKLTEAVVGLRTSVESLGERQSELIGVIAVLIDALESGRGDR